MVHRLRKKSSTTGWAKAHGPDRVHFYLPMDADARLLAPWRDAGLPLSRIEQ